MDAGATPTKTLAEIRREFEDALHAVRDCCEGRESDALPGWVEDLLKAVKSGGTHDTSN
jgi:hypothetical protein